MQTSPLFAFSGKEGIRTLEALLTLTRFPGGPLQPLEHLSNICVYEQIDSKISTTSYPQLRLQRYDYFLIRTKKVATKDVFTLST